MKQVKGFRHPVRSHWKLAKEYSVRAGVHAYRDRHRRKRDFRALWITRLTAACRARGISYSRFIYGLIQADVEVNRKMLSDIAIACPADFDALVDLAKKHQPQAAA
jgi:large subunit ribosomal protein L20